MINDDLLSYIREAVLRTSADYIDTRLQMYRDSSDKITLHEFSFEKQEILSALYPFLDCNFISPESQQTLFLAIANEFGGKSNGLIITNLCELLVGFGDKTVYFEECDPLKDEYLPKKGIFNEDNMKTLKDSIVVLYHAIGNVSKFFPIREIIKNNGNIIIDNCSDVMGLSWSGKGMGYFSDYIVYRFDKYSVFNLPQRAFGLFGNILPSGIPLKNIISPLSLNFGTAFHSRLAYFYAKRKENWDKIYSFLKDLNGKKINILQGELGSPNKFFWFKSETPLEEKFKKHNVDIALQNGWIGLPIYPTLSEHQLDSIVETCKRVIL